MINNTVKATSAIARWAACLMLVMACFFFTRESAYAQVAGVNDTAQAAESLETQSSAVRVFFPINQFDLRADYLDNAASLAAIDSIAALCAADSIATIEIVSYSSPEGVVVFNQFLSEKRSAALRSYIVSRYPNLKGRIQVNPHAEAWGDLRAAVLSDSRLSDESRAKVLEIIDADCDSDDKEANLRALPVYSSLYRSFFKKFRYAEIALRTDAQFAQRVGARMGAGAGVVAGAGVDAGADEKLSRYALLFDQNGTDLDSTFSQNPDVLKALDAALAGKKVSDIKEIKIISGSSPDGRIAANETMSRLRGISAKAFFEAKYPEFSNLVTLESRGEDWVELRKVVKSSKNLTPAQRDVILGVVDNEALGAQAKEGVLRESSSWRALQRYIIPLVRYAAIIPVFNEVPQEPALADTLVAQPADTLTQPVDTLVAQPADTLTQPVDTLPKTLEPVAAPADSLVTAPVDTVISATPVIIPVEETPADEFTLVRKPLFAVTNNLLYEAATVFTGFHSVPLNIGIELPVGQHWSAYANYMATAPWRAWNNNADCAELLHGDLGVKWYPGGSFANPFKPKAGREVLDGWYAYAGVGAGYYDFERNGRGYQGEEILGSLGIGYGLYIGRNWSFDFAVGGGPIFTRYRYYIGRSNNEHLMYQYSGRLTYFGVTDAKVSLRYLIHYNKKVKSVNQ